MAGDCPPAALAPDGPIFFPAEADPRLNAFVFHFTNPTDVRLLTLAAAAILTSPRRTVANLLRTLRTRARGYRRGLLGSLEHRDHLPGMPPGGGPGDHPGVVPEHGW